MPKKPSNPLQTKLSARLRAIQAEMRKSDREMALMLQVGRTRWNNWVTEGNMPEESAMVALCEYAKVTMDWLYRGDASQLAVGHAIRLTARLAGLDPDLATPEQLAPVVSRLASME